MSVLNFLSGSFMRHLVMGSKAESMLQRIELIWKLGLMSSPSEVDDRRKHEAGTQETFTMIFHVQDASERCFGFGMVSRQCILDVRLCGQSLYNLESFHRYFFCFLNLFMCAGANCHEDWV